MKIETTTTSPHPMLTLRGDFDSEGAERFLSAVEKAGGGSDAKLMVSLRYVKYINSTALGAMVRARSICQEAGGDLVVVRPSALSREIISSMGLDRVVRLFDDEHAAADFFAGKGAPKTPRESDNGYA